jgi:multiple sugar transport system substrate-binding protein
MTKTHEQSIVRATSADQKPKGASAHWRRRDVLGAGAAAAAAAGTSFVSPLILTSKARAQDEPLRFWQFTAPGGQNPPRVKWFVDMVEAWNASHDVKVQLEYIPVSQYLGGSKLQTAFAAGEGPDIFVISLGDFLRYYNGGVLMDLTPFMEEAAQNDFFESVMATRVVDGGIYALPMEVEPMAMYYSVAAFEEAGLSEADIPTTWDDLLAVAQKLTTGDRFGVLFETTPGYYQNFTWYPFLWQGGGAIVSQDGSQSAFSSDAAAQALRFWQDAIDAGLAPRRPLGYGANDVAANLGSGYCAMHNVGIWGVSALRDSVPNFDYGVFKLPVPPGGSYTTVLGGWAFVANSQGKNPEAAAEFCVWALGSMSDESIQRVVDWCIRAKSDLVPRKSALERATAEGAFSSGVMQTFNEEIFPGSRGEPRVPPQVYKAISDAIQACQLNGDDPARQAELASQQIDSFLAGYSGAPIR